MGLQNELLFENITDFSSILLYVSKMSLFQILLEQKEFLGLKPKIHIALTYYLSIRYIKLNTICLKI